MEHRINIPSCWSKIYLKEKRTNMILTIAAGFSLILAAQTKQYPLREFLGIIAPGKLQYSSIVSFCKRLKTASDVATLDNFQS